MLLMAAFALAGVAMAAQMVRLGVVGADASLAEAEQRLSRQRSIPTVRGRILDRHGRVLASTVRASDRGLSFYVRRRGRRVVAESYAVEDLHHVPGGFARCF